MAFIDYHRVPVDSPLRTEHVRRSASPMNSVRSQNRQAVLEAIFDRSQTSRKELCVITGLSASTVGLIVNDLIERGILYESGSAASERGRKPIAISFDPAFVNILAVDVDEMSANVFDLQGNALLEPTQFEVDGPPRPADVVQLVRNRLQSLPADMKWPGVVGVSVPGTVNSATGQVLFSSNLGWDNVALGSLITRETGIPVIIESNMVCLTLTEAWFGAASDADTFGYIHAGWRGVGGGLVLGGNIYRGANSNGAEIGHMQVDPHGPQCSCGKRGCVEVLASGKATLERARARLLEQGAANAKALTWSELIQAEKDGNATVRQVLTETGRILGQVAANMVLFLDPNKLVFGGRVMEAHNTIMPVIRQVISEQVLSSSAQNLALDVATDSREKSMAGAARIAARSYLFSMP